MFTLNGCTPQCQPLPYQERVFERIEESQSPKKQEPSTWPVQKRNFDWVFVLFLALLFWALFKIK